MHDKRCRVISVTCFVGLLKFGSASLVLRCAMPRNADRAGHVQVLQGFARDCKVTPVRSDEARRKAVTEVVERIRTSDGPSAAKRGAEAAFTRYKATFIDAALATPPPSAPAAGFRLRGKSFLLTYNWDYFGIQHKKVPMSNET